VAEGQRALVADPPARAGGTPPVQRHRPQREGAGRRHAEETEPVGAGVPFDDGGVCPRANDAQGTGDYRQARTQPAARFRVVGCRQRVGAGLQANRVLVTVGIGGLDGVKEAGDVARATMEGLRLALVGLGQDEPEGEERRHPPGATPPAPLPLDPTGRLVPLLRLLFQRLDACTTVVHAIHVRALL
jgi:hypothetical protein